MSVTRPKVPVELQDLAIQVGRMIHYWGFKEVHGRIWTHLFLAKSPLDAAEIMKRLSISKALVSISLADLLKYEVILEAGKSAQGTLLYRASPEVGTVILRVLRQREQKMLAQTMAAFEQVRKLAPEVKAEWDLGPKNLKELGDLIQFAEGGLDDLLSLGELNMAEFRQFVDQG